ncbi:unnamed protein product, partial [Symbiodinium natans]
MEESAPKKRCHFAIRKGDVYKACSKCNVVNIAHVSHDCPKNGRTRRPGNFTGRGHAEQQMLLHGLIQRCGGRTMRITSVGGGESVLGHVATELLQQIQVERVEADEEQEATTHPRILAE